MRVRWSTSLAIAIVVMGATLGGAVPAQAADDVTPPMIVPAAPAIPPFPVSFFGSYYRQHAVVNAEYTCNDEPEGSGIAFCIGTVPDGSPIDTSTLGFHSFEIYAQDNAGNEKTLLYGYWVSSPVLVSITSATVVENDQGKQAVKLAVETNGIGVPFALGYHTEAGSADASDFTPRSGTLSFYKIETTKGGTFYKFTPRRFIIVPLLPDTNGEDTESFDVVLNSITDPTLPVDIVDGTGTVTILDDDVNPDQRVSVSDVTAREGRTMYFVVALARPATAPVTVPFSVTGDTATGGKATLVGGDFVAKKPGTLTFRAGQKFKYIPVRGRFDTADEINETLHVNLGTPTGASLYRATGTGTILDDD